MFHAYGLTTVVNAGLYAHATIVILRSKSPSEITNTIVEHSVTIAIMVPPMYNLLARRGEPEVMKSVHTFISEAPRFRSLYPRHSTTATTIRFRKATV